MHANLYYCLNVSMHSIEKLPRHNVDAMGEIKEKRTSSAGVSNSLTPIAITRVIYTKHVLSVILK